MCPNENGGGLMTSMARPSHQRSEHGIAEVETSEGLIGLTQIGRGTPTATIEETLSGWLGQDVLSINLASLTTPMAGAFEQAILDLRGSSTWGSDLEFAWWEAPRSHLCHPVYRLQDAAAHSRGCTVGMGTRLSCLQDEVHH